ncbi:hypothetical protein GGF46_002612 [Coemansia sp. RSA 552]|nr:hypothetical protein GGF46_002612 [Coemansia sp. RSA 552]
MTQPGTFPRLRSSPPGAGDSADLRTFVGAGGFRSLPQTPRTTGAAGPAAGRTMWAAMRRDRQSRMHTILQARGVRATHTTTSEVRRLSSRDLPKAIRMRARDVGWMAGQRGRRVRLSALASALRATSQDEDDVIADALAHALAAGGGDDETHAAANFEAIQEIVALRHTLRLLLRMQMEHPSAAVRKNMGDILARAHGPKKTLKVPLPLPLAAGPSFFFAPQRFAPAAQLAHDSTNSSSSSSDSSDSDSDSDSEAAPEPRLLLQSDSAAHLLWARRFADAMDEQWHNGAPRLLRLLTPLPQCGFALATTLAGVFAIHRSSVREPHAHYLFACGAAQVGCYPLVGLAESRVMASCYDDDDGDVYEAWLTHGLAAASPHTQLLARLGHLLATEPWALTAAHVRRLVDEHVRLHTAQAPASDPCTHTPPRAPLRMGVQRSLSTSVVSTVAPRYALPPLTPEFSRRSLHESAVRDLLHAVVVMAVAHGLGSFAGACGIAPDLDLPAGSFFASYGPLMPVEHVPGLAYADPPPSKDDASRQHPNSPVSAELVDRVERNTADLISRLQTPTFLGPDSATASAMAAPPVDARLRPQLCDLATVHDPLLDPAPQFAAYRQMRARSLARYELPPDQGLPSAESAPHPVHLSQREDLRWDVLSGYLRQQLSIDDDYLGTEVQAARSHIGQLLADSQLATSASGGGGAGGSDDPSVYVADQHNAPVKSEPQPDTEDAGEWGPASGTKSYMPNILALHRSPRGLARRSLDARRFHDAIWHFTLSLFHIYEEFYFYSNFAADPPSAMSVPARGPSDMDIDDEPRSLSGSGRWLTDELKDHIRAVVRRPAAIPALHAQPALATGLNLSVEEMVHINLIVSLARRQAEIIHSVRAIRDYAEQIAL